MEERRQQMKDLVKEKGKVMLAELEQMFPDVSSMTIRRDLAALEDRGALLRVRGGVVAAEYVSDLHEDAYGKRVLENVEAKKSIARAALKYVETGRSVYIDAGTTTMMLAKMFPKEKMSVITSGANIALELNEIPNVFVNLPGGTLNKQTLSMSGSYAERFIKNVNIDIAFMATSGFSLDCGFTSGDIDECNLKREVIRKARKVILLMDTSKVDKNLIFTFAEPGDIDVLITEKALPSELIKKIKSFHLELECGI